MYDDLPDGGLLGSLKAVFDGSAAMLGRGGGGIRWVSWRPVWASLSSAAEMCWHSTLVRCAGWVLGRSAGGAGPWPTPLRGLSLGSFSWPGGPRMSTSGDKGGSDISVSRLAQGQQWRRRMSAPAGGTAHSFHGRSVGGRGVGSRGYGRRVIARAADGLPITWLEGEWRGWREKGERRRIKGRGETLGWWVGGVASGGSVVVVEVEWAVVRAESQPGHGPALLAESRKYMQALQNLRHGRVPPLCKKPPPQSGHKYISDMWNKLRLASRLLEMRSVGARWTASTAAGRGTGTCGAGLRTCSAGTE
jgi:hypothetical protein